MLEIIKSEELICIPNEVWGILKYFKPYMLSFIKIQKLKYPAEARNSWHFGFRVDITGTDWI